MPCHSPITLMTGQVPCGRCDYCRLKYSYEWSVRCAHEATLYEHNCFITLTYDDSRLPPDYRLAQGLIYSHFQIDFLKALRDRCGGFTKVKHHNFGKINKKTGVPYPEFHRPIRFFVAGEYGDKNLRPHWHACIFNFDFSDKYFWRKSKSGYPIFRSPTLEELWPYGNSEIGSVTSKSAGYCARYIFKKQTGERAVEHYKFVDVDGTVFDRRSEFCKASIRPGLGDGWFRKYHADVFPHDYVVVDGQPRSVPRFYDKKYKQMTGEVMPVVPFFDSETGEVYEDVVSPEFENVKFDRRVKALKYVDDNTPQRLQQKRAVLKARLSNLKRDL